MNEPRQALYSAEQVRELDRLAIEAHGISGYELMQRAARACWQALVAHFPDARTLTIVCGNGNNGGDGYEIARLAHAEGWRVTVIAPYGLPAKAGDAQRACAAWQTAGHVQTSFDGELPPADVIVDALFGTGLARRLDALGEALVDAMNVARARGARIVAADLPSGLDASTGATAGGGACAHADLTVSFIGRKLGLYTGQGPQFAGRRVFASLDVPDAVYTDIEPLAFLQTAQQLREALPTRVRTAHKGNNGHVVVIGGNHGMAGAALLAARAALRAGAGLVSVVTRVEHAVALTAAQPELMCHGSDDHDHVRTLLRKASCVVIGPGLGTDDWARGLYAIALDAQKPLLLDADALNLLTQAPITLDDAVLTPHPGEAARLLGCGTSEIQSDRLGVLRALERRYGASVVLKGAGSLVSGQPASVCPFGNPGMAVGGMGDVLSGVIGAFRAQGLSAESAAAMGVLAHALAGDKAAVAGERGLLPSDLIAALREVINP